MFARRTVGILKDERIDIWANPSLLPEAVAREYDELWTVERMDRVICGEGEGDCDRDQ